MQTLNKSIYLIYFLAYNINLSYSYLNLLMTAYNNTIKRT